MEGILVGVLPYVLWTFSLLRSSLPSSSAFSWEAGMSRQRCWWSQLQPQPEHSLLEQAPLLIAGPFSLSSVHTLAALLGCCAFSSTLSCWHSTQWKSFRVLTDRKSLPHSAKLVAAWPPSLCHQRKVFPPFVLLPQGSTPSWLSVHFHLPASLCLSMNRSKKYSPGFMLCWLNQSEQTTLGHLFLGLDPN